MIEWFRVEVTDRDGQIVAIESEMLAGRDIGEAEEAVIRKAIEHLSGFIGKAGAADFNPDECNTMNDWDEPRR